MTVDHFELRQYIDTGHCMTITTLSDWFWTRETGLAQDGRSGLYELVLLRNDPEKRLPAPCGDCLRCQYTSGECKYRVDVDVSHKSVTKRSKEELFAAPLGVFDLHLMSSARPRCGLGDLTGNLLEGVPILLRSIFDEAMRRSLKLF